MTGDESTLMDSEVAAPPETFALGSAGSRLARLRDRVGKDRPRRILVVDDNASSRDTSSMLLRSAG